MKTIPCDIRCVPGCKLELVRVGDGLLDQSGDGWALLADRYECDCARRPSQLVAVKGAPPVCPAVEEVRDAVSSAEMQGLRTGGGGGREG